MTKLLKASDMDKDQKKTFLTIPLRYEIKMLLYCFKRLNQAPSCGRNAVIESFALHVRTLNEFFFKKGHWPDDVRAGNFTESWNLDNTTLKDVVDSEINKWISHMTTARVFEDQQYEFPQDKANHIIDEIRKAWDAFNNQLSVEFKECKLQWSVIEKEIAENPPGKTSVFTNGPMTTTMPEAHALTLQDVPNSHAQTVYVKTSNSTLK